MSAREPVQTTARARITRPFVSALSSSHRLPSSTMRSAAAVLGAVLLGAALVTAQTTILDDYVNAYDPTYRWELANTVAKDGYTFYALKLVSQTWLTPDQIDRTVWEHWIRVCVPNNVRSDLATMYINGGGNPLGGAPSSMDDYLVNVCLNTQLIVIELGQIPNQPIKFADEDFGRSEDAFLAKTWDNFIKTRDGLQIGRLPMVKASVRAMDALTEFVRQYLPSVPAPTRWAVAGGSKRGWTTWLTGAVDRRVVGIAPIVIEVLQMTPNLNFEWQVYGRWPVAFGDYTDMNITRCLNCPVFQELGAIEDPYSYLYRFIERKVPIFSISATGDEFFLPDGYQWWYNTYQGEKYLGIQPNAEHSMFNRIEELTAALGSYVVTLDRNLPRPKFTWTMSADGSTIRVQSTDRPVLVRAFEAYNKRSRSFIANCYLTCLWRETVLQDLGNNTYAATFDIPTEGYRGFFIELHYQVAADQPPMVVTTGSSIIPKQLPYPPCEDSVCGLCDSCEPVAPVARRPQLGGGRV
eukprot:Unigene1322_Nuclearia_a/m.4205 Unigene1322_Nuclearia_a/g.4205  ORF Unigene1322_Nuclearia_a/g.4205 Unigene1322_Nuclearia_a/m.4205 type:complete len:523 (+) Unigene1322_Nuclearia_a:59-1627(+)